jgi:hypothetical protein
MVSNTLKYHKEPGGEGDFPNSLTLFCEVRLFNPLFECSLSQKSSKYPGNK